MVAESVRKWTVEPDGTIRFQVTSNGRTGEEWIAYFGERRVSKWAKDVLRSKDFQPTNGVTYDVVVIPGNFWKTDGDRTTQNIRAEGEEKRKWLKPHAEVGCLIRRKFSNEEIEKMGLYWIVAMHEPIKDSGGDPNLLRTSRGDCTLFAYFDRSGHGWNSNYGFAFVLPQVSS